MDKSVERMATGLRQSRTVGMLIAVPAVLAIPVYPIVPSLPVALAVHAAVLLLYLGLLRLYGRHFVVEGVVIAALVALIVAQATRGYGLAMRQYERAAAFQEDMKRHGKRSD